MLGQYMDFAYLLLRIGGCTSSTQPMTRLGLTLHPSYFGEDLNLLHLQEGQSQTLAVSLKDRSFLKLWRDGFATSETAKRQSCQIIQEQSHVERVPKPTLVPSCHQSTWLSTDEPRPGRPPQALVETLGIYISVFVMFAQHGCAHSSACIGVLDLRNSSYQYSNSLSP